MAGAVFGSLLAVWSLRLDDQPSHPLMRLLERWSPFPGWWARRCLLDLMAVLLFAAATFALGSLLAAHTMLQLG